MARGGNLTLKQLQCLIAVEQTTHFRRAAEMCGITQPSLSAQIGNLEESLGVKLVERSRSGVSMTPAGREIALRARRIADETQGIADFAAEAKHGLSGTFRLGSKPTLGPYLLPHVVSALHRQYKDLNLYIRESEPRNLEFELAGGVHDLVLTQLPATNAEHVEAPLFQEPLYLAVAVDHPLAKEKSIKVDDLAGLDILSLNPNFHLHDRVHSLCEDFGARLVGDYEGTSLDAIRQMVGMGMGATFLPALYAHSEISARSEVAVRPLRGRTVTRTIGLIWRKSAGRAEAYKRFADIIRDVAEKRFKDVRVLGRSADRKKRSK
jgi:LysR family hydrogen peroxide-inducible transcriptional activator